MNPALLKRALTVYATPWKYTRRPLSGPTPIREAFAGVPPVYQGYLKQKIEELQKREWDATSKYRYTLEKYTLSYKEQLERYFLKNFYWSTDPVTGQQVWNPVMAKAVDADKELMAQFDKMLEGLGEEIAPDLEEEALDAAEEGELLGLWGLEIGGIDTSAYELLPTKDLVVYLAAAAIGGIGIRQRFGNWLGRYRSQWRRILMAEIAALHTLQDTYSTFELATDSFINNVISYVRDELFWSLLNGEDLAQSSYGGLLKGEMWYTREDERVCPQCWKLHGTITRLRPIRDTHPRCRCQTFPIPKEYFPVVRPYHAFASARRAYRETF